MKVVIDNLEYEEDFLIKLINKEDEKYCGWTNYQTWAVNLWLNNDEGTYRFFLEEAERIKDNPEFIVIGDEKYLRKPEARLSAFIKEELEENNPIGDQANLYVDILRYALSHVNYWEIAEGFLLLV